MKKTGRHFASCRLTRQS